MAFIYKENPMVKKIIVLWIVGLLPFWVSAGNVNVIPYPAHITGDGEKFVAIISTIAYADDRLKSEAAFLQSRLLSHGIKAGLKKGNRRADVVLSLDKTMNAPESYRMYLQPGRILIEGADRAGVFYGIQSFLQLLHARDGKELPRCEIEDTPRYSWRGFMLDEARHFFGKEKVRQLLDEMAYFKLNKFHWHLTDEQGWRIEIKKYPELTRIGGKGSWSDPEAEARYYTREDIKEIVDYAALRHIEVIPEIDMPGHATAANRAYPVYSGGGVPDHPEYTFNPGKEETYGFLTDILREVAELFPSSYLHIGGDEVAFGIEAWKSDPDVQALMKREGLKDVKQAEYYFIRRMDDTVKALGKTLVGWDELLDADVKPDNTVVMWWRHDRVNVLKKSLEGHYRTILCPRRPLYFDFIQHDSHKWGRVWDGFCPLQDVYDFPDKGWSAWNISAKDAGQILGIQANLWTERIHNEKRFDFMIRPRICALAESAWSMPDVKDYTSFCERMRPVYRLWDEAGVYYFDPRQPGRHPEPEGCSQPKKQIPMDFRD